MQRLALDQGVSADRILLEPTAASTLDSAIACTQIMATHQWSRVLVVSDQYHLLRAVLLFRQLGVEATGSAPDLQGWDIPRTTWYCQQGREVLALPWSLLRLWRRKIGRESR